MQIIKTQDVCTKISGQPSGDFARLKIFRSQFG